MRTQFHEALYLVFLLLFLDIIPSVANNTNNNPNESLSTPFPSLLVNDTLDNPSACMLSLPILDDDCSGEQEFPVQVINPPGDSLGIDVFLEEVRLIIGHEWDLDIDIFLISPSGASVTLSTDNGDTDDNYGDPLDPTCSDYTTFLSHSSTQACNAPSIEDGSAPFIGNFLPEGNFEDLNDGVTNPEGIWILKICDDAEVNEGTLEFVELVFSPLVCIRPSQVEVIASDSTSVTLNWSSGLNCHNTILEYGLPGFTPGNAGMVGGGIAAPSGFCAPPFTISNLLPNTTYEFYLREYCGVNNYSENSCPIIVTTSCSPPPPTLIEDFDSQALCDPTCGSPCNISGTWRNSLIDGFDWIVHSGSTTSSQTGPSDDAGGDNGNYIYIESSGPDCQRDTAILISNCIEVSAKPDTCDMSFFYHMFGFHTGSLTLEITTDGGLNWERLWFAQGNKGDEWFFQFIDLSPYHGQIAQFRFLVIGGNGFRSDIALDQITFYGSLDLGPGSLIYYADEDGDGYGNPDKFFRTCYAINLNGFTPIAGDCDDENDFINPSVDESPCDGLDLNCNGNDDELILPPPNIPIDTIKICSGAQVIVEANPQFFGGIYWYDQITGGIELFQGQEYNPGILPENNSPNPIFLSYYAEEQNFFGCSSQERAEVVVAIFPNPELSSNDQVLICAGEAFDLATLNIIDINQAGTSFDYYIGTPEPGNQLNSSVIHPTSNTNYTILGVTPIGCRDTLDFLVEVKPSPHPLILGDETICRGTSSSLTVADIGSGILPLTYLWNTGATNPTIPVFSNPNIGATETFTIEMTGANGCSGRDTFELVTVASIQSVSTFSNDVTSCDGTDGIINISISGGIAPFDYNWEGPNQSTGFGSSNFNNFTISNLEQGAYSITIIDNSVENCSFAIPSTVVNGPSVDIKTPVLTEPDCFGGSDGCIFIDVVGNNFSITWNTGDTTELLCGLEAGNYEATVVAGTCITQIPVTLTQPPNLMVNPLVNDVTCPGDDDGKIKLDVFGGTPIYFFKWETNDFQDSLVNLSSGTYNVTVSDIQNCEVALSIPVDEPNPILIDTVEIQQVSCFGGRGGSIEISVTGGTPFYSILWSNGNTTSKIGFLEAGFYGITVTDFNGCTASQLFEITDPPQLEVSVQNVIDATCNGIDDGKINILPIGGSPPYIFEWNNGNTNQNASDLGAGFYHVLVIDNNQCAINLDSIEVSSPAMIMVEKNIDPAFCPGIPNGTIEIVEDNIQGGTPPFSFFWNNGETSNTLSNLAGGSYFTTITDSAGCIFHDTTILESGQPMDLIINDLDPACFQTNTGSITITPVGGNPQHSILWNDGNTNFNRISLSEGTYWATITDQFGCYISSDTIALHDPSALELEIESKEDNVCFGAFEGSIDVTPIGGVPPYNFMWSNGNTSEDVSLLPTGDYTVTLTDSNSCPFIQSFQIVEPPQMVLETNIVNIPECDLDPIDSVCVSVSGGIAPHDFNWSNGVTASCLVGAPTGEYSITVTDNVGCTHEMESIKYPDPIEPLSVELLNEISQLTQCFHATDGVLAIEFQGGDAPYQFNWNHGLTGSTAQDTLIMNDLASGICQVTVVDGKGCLAVSDLFEIGQAEPLNPTIVSIENVKCFNGSDGIINLDVTGGSEPYNYHWFTESNDTLSLNQDLDNLPAGAYSVMVEDSIGCNFLIEDIPIAEPEKALTLLDNPVIVQNVRCFGDSTGSINIQPEGGVPPYIFDWSNGATTEDISQLPAGEYGITLTDDNECLLSSEILVEEPDTNIHLISEEVIDANCHGGGDGSVLLSIEGGWEPYEFLWNDPNLTSTLNLVDVSAGDYTITITDSEDCQLILEYTIGQASDIVLVPGIVDATSQMGGSASIEASGGQAPYFYEWSTGSLDMMVSDLTPGIYSVTVTDSDNCTAVAEVEIKLVDFIENDLVKEVILFPNPTSGTFVVKFELLKVKDLDFRIINLLGEAILDTKYLNQRNGVHHFNIMDRAPGIYLFEMSSENQLLFHQKIFLSK